jgi:ubiquinone/menaquinone biosynthesis C-methylase UbiE
MDHARRVDDVTLQYGSADPLQVRIDTYRYHQERALNLDHEASTLLALQGDEAVLDVGCGPGRFLGYLHDTGHSGRLTGFDLSAGMIAEARQSAASIAGIVGDVVSLPFLGDAFDVVVSRHMLYHVGDIPAAIGELGRVGAETVLISTGSRLSTMYLDSLLARVVEDFGYSPATRIMSRFCTENASEWLSTAGFTYTEVLLDNALVFRTSQPVVAYVLSCLPSFGIVPGSQRYAETTDRLEELVAADLEANNGEIRDPTRVGFYVARKK